MPINCLVLAAAICVDQPAEVKVFTGTTLTGASIRTDDLSIESTINSDQILPANLSVMHKACSASGCYYYFVYCAPENDAKSFFIYYTDRKSNYSLRSIELRMPSAKNLSSYTNIYFSPVTGYFIRFSDLTRDDGSKKNPICLPRQGCTPHRP